MCKDKIRKCVLNLVSTKSGPPVGGGEVPGSGVPILTLMYGDSVREEAGQDIISNRGLHAHS